MYKIGVMNSAQVKSDDYDGRSGFSVAPSADCPHIAAEVFSLCAELTPNEAKGKMRARNVYEEKIRCLTCGDNSETWICLRCGTSACGRYINEHMLQHANDRSASSCAPVVAIGLADLSAWCFACDDYVTHPKLEPVFRELHRGKFGSLPDGTLHL